jgi:hypothetical protein
MWYLLACLTSPADYRGYVDAILDSDGDGYVDSAFADHELASDYLGVDCDDEDGGAFPGAPEICDGVDQDCDGDIDEDLPDYVGWFVDADGDGYGDPSAPVLACPFPDNAVEDGSDCDDLRKDVAPGRAESCNVLDDDCDGEVDEGVQQDWYVDADEDGYGDEALSLFSCDPGEGYAESAGDCDDGDPGVSPGVDEVCNDGIDNDCDESTDCRLSGSSDWGTIARAYGSAASGSFGGKVTAGSYAGDERGALLVGDIHAEREGEELGAAYLFSRGPNELQDADAVFFGAVGSDTSVGVELFDLDGDGLDDVLLGDDRVGRDVIAFMWPFPSVSEFDDAALYLDGGSGRFGHAIAGIRDDSGGTWVSVGAFTALTGGAVFVSEYTGPGTFDGMGEADVTIEGSSVSDEFGKAVEVGDLDGDGVSELLVGAPGESSGAEDSGAVYIFSQPLSGSLDATDADLTVQGVVVERGAGWFVRAEDVSGDGRDDLLVGAPGQAQSDAGALFVFTQNPTGFRSTDGSDLEVLGTSSYGALGASAVVLDLDGSGAPDLAVSDPGAGAVFLFYDVRDSGSFDSSDAEASVDAPGVQLLELERVRWSTASEHLIIGCPKCGDDDEGALLSLLGNGP